MAAAQLRSRGNQLDPTTEANVTKIVGVEDDGASYSGIDMPRRTRR